MRLSEKGLTLGDVDLGGMDAESDPDLENYFLTTSYVDEALHGKPHIFLGRKGSGKSSIFSQLPRLAIDHGSHSRILLLSPDAYAWATLKGYRESEIGAEQAHTNAWHFTLALELALFLLHPTHKWSAEARKGLNEIQRFVGENFGREPSGGLKATSGVLKSLESFNLGAFGFNAGATRAKDSKNISITPDITAAILDRLSRALEEQPVTVTLDRLDDAWDGSEESKSLLIGLLKAAKALNDAYRRPRGQTPTLRVVVFLRTDIYDALDFDDKDKHRPFEQQIAWDEDTLRTLINRRLPESVTVDELFEEGRMRGSVRPFDHILKRTFLRPREVIQFVDQCKRVAGDTATEISKSDVREAENRFSSWKVDDLKQEYAKSEPSLPQLVEALRQQVHRYDSFDELVATLRESATELVENLGEREALQVLFDSSVIGIRLSGTGSTRFKATSPELSLPTSGVVYVHQGLYKGLNLTETRKSAEEGIGGDGDYI